MKYIRTKEKIYEVESSFLNNDGKWIGYNIVGNDMVILKVQVIAKADTIEELVDATVIVSPKGSHSITLDEYDLVNLGNKVFIDSKWRNDLINAGNIIYGAIWTDKGLIYVAKMNDKGELELI